MRFPRVLAAWLLFALVAGSSQALPAVDVEAQRSLESALPIAAGEPVKVEFTVTNRGSEDAVVVLRALAPSRWNASTTPDSFALSAGGPGSVRTFALHVQAPERPGATEVNVRVLVQVVNATGSAVVVEQDVAFHVSREVLVLGFFQNPLPAPLDNAYGVALLDFAFWALIAGLLIAFHDRIVRWLTRTAERSVSARIANTLRMPAFIALVFFGVTQSWEALPSSPMVEFGLRALAAMTVLVLMYVAYKAFRAVLIYYIENIAANTETELDDILMPVLEKVGGVVIVAAGTLYFLGSLGIDLGGFVAGGVVVSMVLAFAAQDTLSNFFAGIFLLLDRPFVRGDDIMLTAGSLENNRMRVEQIGLRTARLYRYSTHEVIVVPNNELAKNPIINMMFPDNRWRVGVDVGVAYDSDVDTVRDILLRACREHPAFVPEPKPIVRFEGFGDSALQFQLRFFISDVRKRKDVASDVRLRILEDFRQAGVEIPFPQRVVTLKGEAGGNGGPGADAGPGPHQGARSRATPPKAPDAPKRS